MQYMAQRVTGDWLDRDLPITDGSTTVTLSGPSGITGNIDPEMRQTMQPDGLPLLDGWSTIIYAVDDNGAILTGGLVIPPTGYEESTTSLTVAGFSTYPHGYFYTDARNWGPSVGKGTTANPDIPRPDPIVIFRDHWTWIQSQADSDLGVTIVGDLTSTTTTGTFADPYRLALYEYPDLGEKIDDLASQTPFDYVEESAWIDDNQDAVARRIRVGFPRVGTRRDDLRFADGENIAAPVSVTTSDTFANDVIGVGKGTGKSMVSSRATIRDGRLRRTKILTNKAATQANMDRRVALYLAKLNAPLDITEVQIIDHPNARISEISVGDDIYVQTEVPAYGDVALWVRVTGITVNDSSPYIAVLTTSRSSAFIYNTQETLST